MYQIKVLFTNHLAVTFYIVLDNPSTNVPVATMLILAVMFLYLPWVWQYCRQLIWKLWLKKTKEKCLPYSKDILCKQCQGMSYRTESFKS